MIHKHQKLLTKLHLLEENINPVLPFGTRRFSVPALSIWGAFKGTSWNLPQPPDWRKVL